MKKGGISIYLKTYLFVEKEVEVNIRTDLFVEEEDERGGGKEGSL
jgi:hypothetical protein